MLEATLLFGGMGLHDQHSDMRLDVDNMSYEVRSVLDLVLLRSWSLCCSVVCRLRMECFELRLTWSLWIRAKKYGGSVGSGIMLDVG